MIKKVSGIAKPYEMLAIMGSSGSGKTTLVKHGLSVVPQLSFSISATTRPPRGEEKDGQDYYFLTPEEFRAKISEDGFVEFEEVYTDKYYGTLKSEVERIWQEGKVVIFDVDVKGGIRLKEIFGDKALSIFVMPPSIAELEQRLIKRNTDCAETIKTRVEKAGEEMTYQKHFDKIIVNTDLDTAKVEVEKIINNFINK